MQPYEQVTYGRMTTTHFYPGSPGNESVPATPDQTVTTSQLNVAKRHIHTGWSQVQGDFKSPTPHSYSVSDEAHANGIYLQRAHDGGFVRLNGPGLAGGTRYITADYDAAYNRAVDKLYEKLRSGLDLSIDLAERGQVVRMVKNVLSIRKLALKVKDLPGTWLEYQYGWRPLVSSIYEAGLVLQRQAERRCIQLYKARASDNLTKTEVEHSEADGLTDTFLMTSSRRCEIGCKFALSDKWYELAADYTSLNPLSIAWELTPYSFVVDWVYDVGGYLRNMESSLVYSSAFESGYVTRTELDSCRKSRQFFTPTSTVWKEEAGFAAVNASRRYKQRDLLFSPPVPRPPAIQAKLGWQRLVSAAALLSKAFRR